MMQTAGGSSVGAKWERVKHASSSSRSHRAADAATDGARENDASAINDVNDVDDVIAANAAESSDPSFPSAKRRAPTVEGWSSEAESGARTHAGGAASASATDRARRIRRLRFIARLMDSAVAVPGTRYRIGLDPILGLVPGAGDLVSSAFSIYIIFEGVKLGATSTQVLKMLGNVAIDTVVGAVPALGDVFDAAFKANKRNLKILGIDLDNPGPGE
jgi:Domain of unknown function (DUF4112)